MKKNIKKPFKNVWAPIREEKYGDSYISYFKKRYKQIQKEGYSKADAVFRVCFEAGLAFNTVTKNENPSVLECAMMGMILAQHSGMEFFSKYEIG